MIINSADKSVFMQTEQTTKTNQQSQLKSEQADNKNSFKVNMHAISKQEIRELMHAGVDGGFLDMVPIKTVFDAQGNLNKDGGIGWNEKMDLIGTLNQQIAFKQSRGEQTTSLEQTMAKYMAIHNKSFQLPSGKDYGSY